MGPGEHEDDQALCLYSVSSAVTADGHAPAEDSTGSPTVRTTQDHGLTPAPKQEDPPLPDADVENADDPPVPMLERRYSFLDTVGGHGSRPEDGLPMYVHAGRVYKPWIGLAEKELREGRVRSRGRIEHDFYSEIGNHPLGKFLCRYWGKDQRKDQELVFMAPAAEVKRKKRKSRRKSNRKKPPWTSGTRTARGASGTGKAKKSGKRSAIGDAGRIDHADEGGDPLQTSPVRDAQPVLHLGQEKFAAGRAAISPATGTSGDVGWSSPATTGYTVEEQRDPLSKTDPGCSESVLESSATAASVRDSHDEIPRQSRKIPGRDCVAEPHSGQAVVEEPEDAVHLQHEDGTAAHQLRDEQYARARKNRVSDLVITSSQQSNESLFPQGELNSQGDLLEDERNAFAQRFRRKFLPSPASSDKDGLMNIEAITSRLQEQDLFLSKRTADSTDMSGASQSLATSPEKISGGAAPQPRRKNSGFPAGPAPPAGGEHQSFVRSSTDSSVTNKGRPALPPTAFAEDGTLPGESRQPLASPASSRVDVEVDTAYVGSTYVVQQTRGRGPHGGSSSDEFAGSDSSLSGSDEEGTDHEFDGTHAYGAK